RLLTVEHTVHRVDPGLPHFRARRVGRDREGSVLDLEDDFDAVVERLVAAGLYQFTEDALVGEEVAGVGAGVGGAGLGTDVRALLRGGEPRVRVGHRGHPRAGGIVVLGAPRDRPGRAGR